MDRETAQALSPLTSSINWRRGIQAYVDSREKDYINKLMNSKTFEESKELIGRVRELRDLLRIAELVDNNKNG